MNCCVNVVLDLILQHVIWLIFEFELYNLLWGKIILLLLHQVIIREDGDRAEIIENVETVEEAGIAKSAEAVESLDHNTVDISDNIVLRKLLVS